MATENTSLKNTTPAGDSNTTNEMVIGKTNTYQRTFLIVAGSLLALLVLIAVAGTRGGQHLQSSAHEIAEGVLAEYQVDSTGVLTPVCCGSRLCNLWSDRDDDGIIVGIPGGGVPTLPCPCPDGTTSCPCCTVIIPKPTCPFFCGCYCCLDCCKC